MLRDLLQYLMGNGTGAAQAAAGAASNGKPEADKKESPLEPTGLTGNRSLQGAAQGAVTAGTGAGLVAAGAVTGNVFLAGAGLSALVQGSTEAAKSLTHLGREIQENSREFSKYSGTIAFANATFDYHQTLRDIEFARDTERSTASAIRGYDRALDATKDLRGFVTALTNFAAGEVLERGTTGANLLRGMLKNYGIDLETFTKIVEGAAGGKPTSHPTMELLRAFQDEGERRRRDETHREERARKDAMRPMPALDAK
jgi:hypothetical protein